MYFAAGDLDPAFRGDGLFAEPLMSGVSDLAVQSDGKIVAAGRFGETSFDDPSAMRLAVVRYDADGSLDESFGDGGRVLVEAGFNTTATALRVLPDGDILVAGVTDSLNGYDDLVLVRLDADGSFDRSFSGNGRAVVNFSGLTGPGGGQASVSAPTDIEIDAAGNILLALVDWRIVRFTPDGSLDGSFGEGGLLRDGPRDGSYLFDLLVLPNGDFLAGGAHGYSESINGSSHWLEGGFDSWLVRYNADGSTDTSFGDQGRADVAFSEGRSEHSVSYFAEAHAPITRLLLQDDGKIVALGYEFSDMAAARFTADGRLDTTFAAPEKFIRRPGQAGEPVLDYGDSFVDGFLQEDGGVIIAASSFGHPDSTQRSLALARLKPSGSLDDSFGDGGVVFRQLSPAAGRGADVRAVAAFGDRRMVAAGAFDSDDRYGYDRAAIARLRLGDAETPPEQPPQEPPEEPLPGGTADTDAPRARLKRGGVEQRPARARFRIVFTDQSPIDATTLGDGDVLVSSRGGFGAAARLERVLAQSGGRRIVAIYSFPAPGGAWDVGDSRLYTFRLAQNAVADSEDNAADEALIRHKRLEFA